MPGIIGLVDAEHRLHHVAGEQANDSLAIALDAEQSVALAGAQQIVEAAETELPFVERRIDAAHELLRLPHVHRESRRVRRRLEDAAHFARSPRPRAARRLAAG